MDKEQTHHATAAVYEAGFAQGTITPPTGTPIAGFFHDRTGKTVRDELYVRAAVLRSGGSELAIVSLDLLCVDAGYADKAKALITQQTGLAPEQVMIAATHTHTGPEVRLFGNKVERNETWLAGLPVRIAQTVSNARNAMTTGTLRAGCITTEGYTHNRLFRRKDGREQMGLGGNPENLLGPAGPVDPDLLTLSFLDETGKVRGILVNFGMHGGPAVGGGKADFISADWPGELSRHLALLYGPETVGLFLLGPCGDTWHHPYGPSLLPQSGPDAAVALGRGLAGAAACSLERAEPDTTGTLDFRFQCIDIPYYTRTPELLGKLAALKAQGSLSEANAFLVSAIETWPHDGKVCRVPLQILRIGDLAMLALPSQIFTKIGLEMKQWSPAAHTMVVELANARVSSYIPTADQVERGAYGSQPILSRWLSTDAGRLMADAILVMLQDLWFPRT